MARKYTESLREAAARAVMGQAGFEFSGASLLKEAATGNPRVSKWVKDADAVLAVVFPRHAAKPILSQSQEGIEP